MIKTILSLFLLITLATSAMADDIDQYVYTLLNDDEDMQIVSAIALVRSGEQSIDPLISALNDTSIDNRGAAVITLASVIAVVNISDSRAMDALIACLNDEDRDVRQSANLAFSFLIPLGKVNDTAFQKSLINMTTEEIGTGLISCGFSSTILNYGNLAIDPFIQILSEGDDESRANAALSLGAIMIVNRIDDENVVSELMRSIREDPNILVRKTSIISLCGILALGNTDSSGIVTPLIEAFNQENDSDAREGISVALGFIGEPAVNSLVDAMTNGDNELRENAAYAIGIGALIGTIDDNTRALNPLLQSLETDSNVDVREKCAWSIGWIGNDAAMDPLINSMQYDDYYKVRGRSAEALGRIGDTRAIDPLVYTLSNDPDEEVRSKAALALGWIGDRRSMNALIKALDDDDCTVITNAGLAIKEIVEAQ